MHNFFEIVYIKNGSAFVAEEDRITELHKGMYIIHEPMVFHRIWCENESAEIMVSAFAANGILTSRLKNRSGMLPVQLRDIYEQMISEGADILLHAQKEENAQKNIFRYTAMLEYILCELAFGECRKEKTFKNTDFDRIIETIHTHYPESVNIPKLAGLCNMSESKMKKCFAEVYDCGIMKYICKLRIRDAAHLLSDGKTTEEICRRLSFSDKNYFSFVFKRETGITPSEYRRFGLFGKH